MRGAGLLLPACSSSTDVGPTVYVDVSLAANCPTPASVNLQVVQGSKKLAEKSFAWPATGAVLKAGVELPSGSAGAVTVSGTGLGATGATVALGGPADGVVGGTAASLILSAYATTGDAGADAQPPLADGDTTDGVAADRVPSAEAGGPDAGGDSRGSSDGAADLPGKLSDTAADVTAVDVSSDQPGDAPDAPADAPTGDTTSPDAREFELPRPLPSRLVSVQGPSSSFSDTL